MPCINIPLEAVGPTMEIGISAPISALPKGDPSPIIHWIKSIADSGCSHTSIHSDVAKAAGLKIISKGTATTPAGVVTTNIYHGDLVLRPVIGTRPFEWRFQDHQFIEMVHKNPAFDALLGMETISRGMFVINGAINTATFCW